MATEAHRNLGSPAGYRCETGPRQLWPCKFRLGGILGGRLTALDFLTLAGFSRPRPFSPEAIVA